MIKLLKNGLALPVNEAHYDELNNFSGQLDKDLVFEWINGQFWLHSDISKEKPIGMEIDRELQRHEEYFKKSSLQKELLARAVGVKGPYRPKVFDLTAGMLGDDLLLLSFGCEVWASERHPVIKFLIESALKNAHHPRAEHFHFLPGEGLKSLASQSQVDVIYFDPMFEDANEKTAPKKEMRIFRSLVGSDHDAEIVFKEALSLRPKRLVVKRPKHSSYLVEKPDVEYIGKSTRYDVYFSI